MKETDEAKAIFHVGIRDNLGGSWTNRRATSSR